MSNNNPEFMKSRLHIVFIIIILGIIIFFCSQSLLSETTQTLENLK